MESNLMDRDVSLIAQEYSIIGIALILLEQLEVNVILFVKTDSQ